MANSYRIPIALPQRPAHVHIDKLYHVPTHNSIVQQSARVNPTTSFLAKRTETAERPTQPSPILAGTRNRVEFSVSTDDGNIPLEQQARIQAAANDFEKARELQVRAMLAGWKGKPKGERWPIASAKTLDAFNSRHSVLKTFSNSYMERQQRTLFLLDVDPAQRFSVFEKECYDRQLKPTTAESVWISFLAIMRFMAPHQIDSTWMTRASKILRGRAIASPVDFPLPMTDEHLREIATIFDEECPDLVTVIGFAYITGQRLADMLQLTAEGVTKMTIQEVEYLCVMVRFGKTMQQRPPYPIFIRWTTWPASRLFEMARRATHKGQIFVQSWSNSTAERDNLARSCRTLLAAVSDDLEMRSPRRGGLQRMASSGIPLETIIKFSHHASQQMLMRYLDWGRTSASHAEEMANALHSNPLLMPTPTHA
jgi:hypothetical protein